MCGGWGIAEPHLAVILFFRILHCLISEFSKKSSTICLLISKNKAILFDNFQEWSKCSSSEFSQTPSKNCNFFPKSGASVMIFCLHPNNWLLRRLTYILLNWEKSCFWLTMISNKKIEMRPIRRLTKGRQGKRASCWSKIKISLFQDNTKIAVAINRSRQLSHAQVTRDLTIQIPQKGVAA